MGNDQNTMYIDKYKAVGYIDKGTFGTVLEVSRRGRVYALKMIKITNESQLKAAN